eukprot:COSAG06_NODE_9481_length_1889_cov_3.913408_1_plen_148_part_10
MAFVKKRRFRTSDHPTRSQCEVPSGNNNNNNNNNNDNNNNDNNNCRLTSANACPLSSLSAFYLCLSRACLGKMIAFISTTKWQRKKGKSVFPIIMMDGFSCLAVHAKIIDVGACISSCGLFWTRFPPAFVLPSLSWQTDRFYYQLAPR